MTTERFNFITRDEFNAHEYKIGQRFDDLTEIMLGEFDKVHNKFQQTDTRLDSIEIRLTTLTEDSKELKLGIKNLNRKFDVRMAEIQAQIQAQGKQLDAIIAKAHISPAL